MQPGIGQFAPVAPDLDDCIAFWKSVISTAALGKIPGEAIIPCPPVNEGPIAVLIERIVTLAFQSDWICFGNNAESYG